MSVHRIGASFDMTGGAALVHLGEVADYSTVIGKLRALTNGAIAFLPTDGVDILELTEEQADEVWKAFMRCSFAARARKEDLGGYRVLRVVKDAAGNPVATYKGVTTRMRLSELRKPRKCSHCGSPVTRIWVSADMPRGHFTECCGSCLEERIGVPRGIRKLGT